MNQIFLWLFLFCFGSLSLSSQDTTATVINLNLQGNTLAESLDKINDRQAIKIYYIADDLPQKSINQNFRDASLASILDNLLANTTLSYFEYRDYAIIIAQKSIVDEFYTTDYYLALQNKSTPPPAEMDLASVIVVGDISLLDAGGKAKVKGTVLDALNSETVIGATINFPKLGLSNVTGVMGEFEFDLPAGAHEFKIQFLGYEDLVKVVQVNSDGEFIVNLERDAITLQEVLVKADAVDVNIENAQIGVERLDVQAIKKLPSFMGEADVVKSLLLQPGVSNVGEGAIGFNVRGGQVDQNLVMQDEGFLFNTSHALGFFSTFNPELISFVTLYKGNIPAEFGGRLASVLDVEMRDGSFKKLQFKGGIGPVSSKLSLEGPIIKDKTSFIMGFRSSYSDWILDLINVPEVKRSSAFFYDLNGRLTHKFNDKNTLILSGYSSSDRFAYNEEFGFDYQTQLGQLIFKSIFSDQLFSKLTATYSNYDSAQLDLDGTDASTLDTNLEYFKLKEKLTYISSEDLELNFGISGIYYSVAPGAVTPSGELSQVVPRSLSKEQGLETALFLNTSWDINDNWTMNAGLRASAFQYLGPKSVFRYIDPDKPRLDEVSTIENFSNGDVIASYGGLEPRASFRYKLDDESSIKFGYSRTKQYINLISNTNTPTPGSQWQLSTEYITPQRSNNFSVGYFKNFEDNIWETSVELYGRLIGDVFDFKNFAVLNLNENIETELLYGEGRAYGAELSIKKKSGLYNGSLSYTLSRSEKRINGVNEFNWYPNNFDKPHDLSLVFNIQANQRNTLTFNFNYGSGRPTTAPVSSYREINNFIVPVYSDRNQLRIPAFHRLDFAYTLGQSYRKDRKFRTSYTFSIYNIYGRSNAFSVFFTQKPFDRPRANQLAIIGNAFPALSINIVSL